MYAVLNDNTILLTYKTAMSQNGSDIQQAQRKNVIMNQWKNYSLWYIPQAAGGFITVLLKIFIQLI